MSFQLIGVCVLILLSPTFVGCAAEQLASPAVFNASHAPTIEFNLPDMMCEDGCAQTVASILERQTGVKEVRVNFEEKTATVAVDEVTFDSQQALAALIDKGFDNSQLAGGERDASSPPTTPEG
jgi:copper chaperone CopZ